MESVEVKAVHIQSVDRLIAEKLCEEFCEWMEANNFRLERDPEYGPDERSYTQLAHDFMKDYA